MTHDPTQEYTELSLTEDPCWRGLELRSGACAVSRGCLATFTLVQRTQHSFCSWSLISGFLRFQSDMPWCLFLYASCV
uniref:Uncharacterized protein n=1 Tax=Mus musculus TaxID=10090 RepID=Q3UT37_MOUSE|nr:unnamed protein product [Mus musculus]